MTAARYTRKQELVMVSSLERIDLLKPGRGEGEGWDKERAIAPKDQQAYSHLLCVTTPLLASSSVSD